MDEAARVEAGITANTLRVSCGIEHPEDLCCDLEAALAGPVRGEIEQLYASILGESPGALSFIDVSRAYFNAKIDEREQPTFVNLPPEDKDTQDMCAQLLRHMYGTRGAADGWRE